MKNLFALMLIASIAWGTTEDCENILASYMGVQEFDLNLTKEQNLSIRVKVEQACKGVAINEIMEEFRDAYVDAQTD